MYVCAAGLCFQSRRFVCIYIYKYVNKKQAVYYVTTRKSPAVCILLLSHWVKMPPVWFAESNEVYRQGNSNFSIWAMWASGPLNIVLWYAKHGATVLKIISPLTALIVVIVLNSQFSSVHWQCSVCTWYVFCGTLVIKVTVTHMVN